MEDLDIKTHKRLIITQILEYGNKEATDWLFATYTESDIKGTIQNSTRSMWSKKSLNFWSLMYGVEPKREGRFV